MATVPSLVSDEGSLVDKPNTKSLIWKYFGFVPDDNGKPSNTDKPQCKICCATVATKTSNTTNLRVHLRQKHPQLYTELMKTSEKECSLSTSKTTDKTLKDLFEARTKLSSNSREHKELTKSVTYFLAKDMLPAYTVEKAGFKQMLSKFNPRYKLPSRNYFSRVAIPALYSEIKSEIQQKINDQHFTFYAGTTDLWSSITSEPYLSYTIHYIDKNWNMCCKCLQTHYMPEAHTAVNLQEALTSSLEQWNLDPDKQVAITTDSGANIKLACELLGWQRLSCFGHNLDLAVNKGLDDGRMRVDTVLRKCRRIVAAFSQSWKRTNELAKVQEQQKLPLHKLKADVSTRWGSTAVMVKRILEQKEAIRIVLSGDRSTSHLAITWQDIDLLASINTFVAPLEDLTDTLSGETHVTISAVKPVLQHLSDVLLAESSEDSELTKEMKARCKAKILQQYGSSDINKLLDIATFLDPRFKHYKDDDQKKKEIEELIKLEVLQIAGTVETASDIQVINNDEGPVAKKSRLGKFLGKKYGIGVMHSDSSSGTNSVTRLTPLEKANNELLMYLQYPQLEVEECPLNWWKKEYIHLPMLSSLAQKFLCICATSVASERTFSTGGNIVTSKRNCLKPHVVDQLVFLAQNLD